MKNPIKLASLLGLVFTFIFISCSSSTTNNSHEDEMVSPSSETEMMSETMAMVEKNTIPLDTFNTWVANWAKLGRVWMDSAVITAYNMPLIDLEEVWKEDGAVSSRFYLGLRNTGKGYEAKMMVVGVDSKNHDMTKNIFDVSRPCPNYCKSSK